MPRYQLLGLCGRWRRWHSSLSREGTAAAGAPTYLTLADVTPSVPAGISEAQRTMEALEKTAARKLGPNVSRREK